MLRVGFTFLRFGQGRWIEAFNQRHAAVEVIQQTAGNARRIDQHTRTTRHRSQGIGDFAVIAQRNAILLQHSAQVSIDLAQCDEQSGVLLIDQRKRNKHRVERHITATQVE